MEAFSSAIGVHRRPMKCSTAVAWSITSLVFFIARYRAERELLASWGGSRR
jgi:hypothetical protein